MQAYHTTNQPYYSQQQYAPAQSAYYYAPYPYVPAVPPSQNHAWPGVYPAEGFDDQDEDSRPPQQFPTPSGRPRPLNRSQSAAVTPTRPREPPLRSIMKKQHERSTSVGNVPILRSRSNSNPRQRVNSSTRPQVNLDPPPIPDHLFLTIHGTNEIRIENIAYQSLLDEFREAILPMWPHGVSEHSDRHRWRAQFGRSPWSSNGTDAILARRLICRLFAVLARQGYSYLTTSNLGSLHPRLVFVNSFADPAPYFFTVSVSSSGDKLSVLDAPPQISHNIGTSLRSVFRRGIASDRATEEGVQIIELKRGVGAPEVDKSLFTAYVLSYFKASGYKLDGTLPIGRSGPLGMGRKKDLWVFRSAPRPASSNGQR